MLGLVGRLLRLNVADRTAQRLLVLGKLRHGVLVNLHGLTRHATKGHSRLLHIAGGTDNPLSDRSGEELDVVGLSHGHVLATRAVGLIGLEDLLRLLMVKRSNLLVVESIAALLLHELIESSSRRLGRLDLAEELIVTLRDLGHDLRGHTHGDLLDELCTRHAALRLGDGDLGGIEQRHGFHLSSGSEPRNSFSLLTRYTYYIR